MNITPKRILVAATLLAAAVTVVDFASGTGIASAAGAKDGSRWSEAFGADPLRPTLTVTATKGDRLDGEEACARQSWPYIEPRCLTSADGTRVRQARTVTIEHRIGDNTSMLIRTSTDVFAAR